MPGKIKKVPVSSADTLTHILHPCQYQWSVGLDIQPPVLVISLLHVGQQNLPSTFTIPEQRQISREPKNVKSPVLVLHLLLDVHQALAINVALQIFRQLLRSSLKVSLVVLKDSRLVVLLQIVGKGVRVHQCPPTFAQGVQGFL